MATNLVDANCSFGTILNCQWDLYLWLKRVSGSTSWSNLARSKSGKASDVCGLDALEVLDLCSQVLGPISIVKRFYMVKPSIV